MKKRLPFIIRAFLSPLLPFACGLERGKVSIELSGKPQAGRILADICSYLRYPGRLEKSRGRISFAARVEDVLDQVFN
jgi:hypothetical protein